GPALRGWDGVWWRALTTCFREASPGSPHALPYLPPLGPHGRGRRVRPPVRMEVDGCRDRVPTGPGPRRLHGGPDLSARGAQRPTPELPLERALSAGELQHRAQPLGNRRRIRRHGAT